MDPPSGVVVAAAEGVDEPLHRPTRDVRHDADHAVAADRQHGQRPAVVAAPDLESVRFARADEPDLVEVAAGFLGAVDAGAGYHGLARDGLLDRLDELDLLVVAQRR